MSLSYRSKQGETLDYICFKRYGKTNGVVEQVLIANPGLAEKGIVLPLSTLVTLPDIDEPSAFNVVRLWT